MKKKLALGVVLASMMAIPTMTSMAGEWINVEGAYWYKNDDGSAYTGWLQDGRKWYFLDRGTCYMRTGWVSDSGKWYYCYDDGSMCPGGWLTLGEDLYYINDDGSMASGFIQVEQYRYETDSNGAIIRYKTQNGYRYVDQGRMMYRDENKNWTYLPPLDQLADEKARTLKERYLEHEYASQSAFEAIVRETFGRVWSEYEIILFIKDLEDEFFDLYDCKYNSY